MAYPHANETEIGTTILTKIGEGRTLTFNCSTVLWIYVKVFLRQVDNFLLTRNQCSDVNKTFEELALKAGEGMK